MINYYIYIYNITRLSYGVSYIGRGVGKTGHGHMAAQLRSGDSGLGDTSGCGLVVKENVGTCS